MSRGDPTPVVGGSKNLRRFLRDVPVLPAQFADSTTKEIATLLALHPEVALRFRTDAMEAMDDGTRRQLLEDIRSVLGVKPFRKQRL